MTKSFDKMAAQGDVMFIRIDEIPADAKPATSENGEFIVAHSETGHHHVVLERNAQMLIDQTNEFIAYLDVANDCEVTHKRSFDTHESIALKGGQKYLVKRQREYVAEGFRRARD